MSDQLKIMILTVSGVFLFISAAKISVLNDQRSVKSKTSHVKQSARQSKTLESVRPEHRIKEENWLKRFKKINHQARADRPDIVFLGDSITHGWKYTNTWNKYYGARKPLNAGIASDRVQHLPSDPKRTIPSWLLPPKDSCAVSYLKPQL
jgi:hypothetical protein